jgi:hypothetical protein
MGRVGRDKQPVPSLHLEGLTADDRLAAVLSRDYPIFVVQILLVGDLAAHDHLACAAGKDVEIINTGVLLGIIPHTIYLGQAGHWVVAVHTVKHEHTEVAGLQMYWPTAERLAAPASRLRRCLGCAGGELRVRRLDVVNVPVSGGRSIGGECRIPGRIVAKRLGFLFS